MNDTITRRLDGKYEERLGESWIAEYLEHPETGMWEVAVFKHNVAEWHGTDFASLDEAKQAAHYFYDQT